MDGFATFRDIKADRYMHAIVDIKAVSFPKVDVKLENIGWSIVPIFSPDGYVMSGIYQVPIIKGDVNEVLIEELRTNEHWPYINKIMKSKGNKMKFLEYTSCIVRVLDSQREVKLFFNFFLLML